jgi:hypothetical protein
MALSLIYPLPKSLGHTTSSQSSLVVSWQRICNSLTVTTTHIKSYFRRLTSLHSFVHLQFSFSLTPFYSIVLLQLPASLLLCSPINPGHGPHRKHFSSVVLEFVVICPLPSNDLFSRNPSQHEGVYWPVT